MARINTNVSSLLTQTVLKRSNNQLQEALTRLSTGLRINSGKDDPAGLIASENLRSDIVSVESAITNSERANQIIATADSALGQVSSLLNDIRGLVTEAANTGALSDAQIAANQIQIDSSLEALNRISQTTSFQGRKLLDGSLDFLTSATSNFGKIRDLKIDQASLGETGSVSVDVSVTTAATQAQVDVTSIPAATAAAGSTGSLTFNDSAAAVQASGTLTLTATSGSIDIDVTSGEGLDGTLGNDINVVIEDGLPSSGDASAVFDGTDTITVTIDLGTADVDDVTAAIDALDEFSATTASGGATVVAAGDETTFSDVTSDGVDAIDDDDVITITSTQTGADFNGTITFDDSQDLGAGIVNVTVDEDNNITVAVDDDSDIDLADIVSAISDLTNFSASLTTSDGDGTFNAGTDTDPTIVDLADGVDASGGLAEDVVFELAGALGAEVFNVKAGSSIADLVAQVNQVKDATGVEAAANGTTLELSSTQYGTNAFVDVRIIQEESDGTFTTAIGDGGKREVGVDVVAKVNGVNASGDGNRLSINTATLDLSLDIDASFTGSIQFNITGGGALFQLGPDVVSNQQARLGIKSVNTASLGGINGKLFELGAGGGAALDTDSTKAALIVEEAIDQVTSLRGRLGAFQRTTVDTNIAALNDTLVNLIDAESVIRDADFAAESAKLTRGQILVQAGTAVLAIANSNPQNVLSLLR
ncbi:MAG: flagellin [Pirellulales bacterium]